MVERFGSSNRWEPPVGYCRAVRAGPLVFVSGTTAMGPDDEIIGDGDAYLQARQALRNIEAALGRAGASLADVVQTRIFVIDIALWEEVGRAHAELLGSAPPTTAVVEVSPVDRPPAAGSSQHLFAFAQGDRPRAGGPKLL
jgi:enamine deaminase RidA (YjgF/YER057c/UK114 family)